MSFIQQPFTASQAPDPVSGRYLADEAQLVRELCRMADSGRQARSDIHDTATKLVDAVRKCAEDESGMEAFLQQYDLSSEEGVLLMCVAEALLRIPDGETADRLIADKITAANWSEHLGESDSLFVNASTWGLMLTGRLLTLDNEAREKPARSLSRLASRAGEPVIRAAMKQAMKIMGHQFVMGRSIEEALKRSHDEDNRQYRHSFDMLGEAALTADDAWRYFDAYAKAIGKIGANTAGVVDINAVASISVKLSALHPRYEYTHYDRVMNELVPRVTELAVLARDAGIALTIDAEEADRLELSLEIFSSVFQDSQLDGYHGLGLAVQAYQRRATDVVRYIASLAADSGKIIPVRLVKGAYWDTEIKRAQERGLDSYPVFTRKQHTDVSYLACAKFLLDAEHVYPQFATHNAHTIASILHFAGSQAEFEFQRLHGMGEALYGDIVDLNKFGLPCRVYAPVGSHEDLLPYLVRRLLENGANTSFVNRISDESVSVEDIVADPITETMESECQPHERIPAPQDLFGKERRNSAGFNIADRNVARSLLADMDRFSQTSYTAAATVGGSEQAGTGVPSANPASNDEVVGTCVEADEAAVDKALTLAVAAQPAWDLAGARHRADILRKASELFEANAAELLSLCVREAGKTIDDAIAELREAVDFLRYYAAQAESQFAEAEELPGPTGERNTTGLRGKGVFVCISPWNFPLAIFCGQVSAALAAGNTVLAKPAEQTPLVAYGAYRLLIEAGVPPEVLHFLPGDGASIGARAVADPRVAGVAFTGSTETARLINRSLALRDGPIATFIAETGGQNAMFVDSTALPEQVVQDTVFSAFNSAGQRCSALRLLCVQEDVADRILGLLKGHMQELQIGDPSQLATDIGPVIDSEARDGLLAHINRMNEEARLIYQCELPESADGGIYVAPVAFEIDRVGRLEREVFGPVLHVLRFKSSEFGKVLEDVNNTGYGLTMGLHSRLDSLASQLAERSAAGNLYINRNMIGAVVGVQPFGGRGLSGTGPKAGGRHYLPRFGSEYTVSNNIAAVGGNASLLSLDQ